MKIYSDKLTEADVRGAFTAARDGLGADIWIQELRTWQPRGYAHGTEVWAVSLHGTQAAAHAPGRAASWDDWGFVIAILLRMDPAARVGFYDGKAGFIARVRQYPREGSPLAFLAIVDEPRQTSDRSKRTERNDHVR